MGDNSILIVLSDLTPSLKSTENGTALPPERSYRYENSDDSFTGIQANEAPVKYLIKAGRDNVNSVTDIFYLCSDACQKKTIPTELARRAIHGFSDSDDCISTETFFVNRIAQHCKRKGYRELQFQPIPFNPSRPADSLDELIRMLKDSSQISIDTTGGPRDAVMLLTLAAQIFKFTSQRTAVGEVVYANFNEKTIHRQNSSFDLIDLIDAVDSFTNYGRADQLKAFFQGNPHITEPTRKLCEAMADFSNALALCQVKGIEDTVARIQRCLYEAEDATRKMKENYKNYTDAIEQIDHDNELRESSHAEAMERVAELNPTIDFSSYKGGALRAKLEELRSPWTVIRSELLFTALIPTIREKFIPETCNRASLSLELIKWCAKHQMAVQALCIYRERIGQCLLDKGFFIPCEEAYGLSDSERDEEIRNLPLNCRIEQKGLRLVATKAEHDDRARSNPNYRINESMESELRTSVAWFNYLRPMRNTIVHVDGDIDNRWYRFAATCLHKNSDESPDLAMLWKTSKKPWRPSKNRVGC